jgi:NADPH:quinone reductase-like Zn-dependent oxidoreductase
LYSRLNAAELIGFFIGTYGLKSTFPAVCGGEGVGRVLEVGAKVVALKPGDVVFPTGYTDSKLNSIKTLFNKVIST